jgi:hypothetical protein
MKSDYKTDYVSYYKMLSDEERKLKYESVTEPWDLFENVKEYKEKYDSIVRDLLSDYPAVQKMYKHSKLLASDEVFEFNSYFTIGNSILSSKNNVTNILTDQKSQFPLICHELVHIMQREYRDVFLSQYHKIGFKVYQNREKINGIITNPDSRELFEYSEFSIVPFLGLEKSRPKAFIFDIIKETIAGLENYDSYSNAFLPNRNVSSPDEIIANSFGMLIYQKMNNIGIDSKLDSITNFLKDNDMFK